LSTPVFNSRRAVDKFGRRLILMASMGIPKELEPKIDTLKADLARAATPQDRLAVLMALADELITASPSDTEPFLTEALDLARRIPDRPAEARTESRLAEVGLRTGGREASIAHAERALALAREIGDQREEARALSLLGILHQDLGDHAKARKLYQQCLVVSQAAGHMVGVRSALNQLGVLAVFQGEFEDALGFWQRLLETYDGLDYDYCRTAVHTNVGVLLEQLGRWEDAAESLYRAIAIAERRGFQGLRVSVMSILGELLLRRNKLDRAVDIFEHVVEARRGKATDARGLRCALADLGQAYLRRGEGVRAGKVYREAMELCQESGDRSALMIVAGCMAEQALAQGECEAAQRLVEQSLRLAREQSDRPQEGEGLRIQALLRAATGDLDGAIESFEAALEALAGSEEGFELARLRLQYGRFLTGQGDRTGVDHLKAAAKTFRRLAVVAEAEEASRLLLRLEMQVDRDGALLQAVSGLPALALGPAQFVEQTLNLMCEALRFERAALLMNGRAVVARGRPDVAAGLDLAQKGELTGSGSALSLPVRVRGKVVGSIYLERTKAGPADYNTAVISTLPDLLTVTVQRLSDSLARADEDGQFVPGLKYQGVVGTNPVMREVLTGLVRAVESHAPVLFSGESGTGKRFLARVLHESGPRSAGPLLLVSCTGMPEDLLAAELFGTERGAGPARAGRLEEAAGGTVFLDEVGGLSPALQAMILRVLERGAVYRGIDGAVKVDVRLVAGTSRDLTSLVQKGLFSAELCRRLGGVEFSLPPLRERKEDIPGLVRYFVSQSNGEFNRQVVDAGPDVVERFLEYGWPGNLSELRHVIDRAVLLASEPMLKLSDIPEGILRAGSGTEVAG